MDALHSVIFLSLTFYVKSILDILEVQHLPFYPTALNFDFHEFLHFLNPDFYQMDKIHRP